MVLLLMRLLRIRYENPLVDEKVLSRFHIYIRPYHLCIEHPLVFDHDLFLYPYDLY